MERTLGACPAGIFPFGLGRQVEFLASLLTEFFAELRSVVPGNEFDWEASGIQAGHPVFAPSSGAKTARILAHHLFVFLLRHREDTHVKWPGDLHFMLFFLGLVIGALALGRAHRKLARLDKDELHLDAATHIHFELFRFFLCLFALLIL